MKLPGRPVDTTNEYVDEEGMFNFPEEDGGHVPPATY